MNRPIASGDEILKLLMSKADLEWARNSFSRISYKTPQGIVTEDRTSEPPFTSFRFKSAQPALIEALDKAIDSYAGKIPWALISHDRSPSPGTNWTICPKLTLDMRENANKSGLTIQKYFNENMPEFGPLAYTDMVDLVLFLKRSLT